MRRTPRDMSIIVGRLFFFPMGLLNALLGSVLLREFQDDGRGFHLLALILNVVIAAVILRDGWRYWTAYKLER